MVHKAANKPVKARDFSRVSIEPVDIHEVRLRSVSALPFARPFSDATMGPFTAFTPSFLRITGSDGSWGECEFPAGEFNLLKNVFRPLLLDRRWPSYQELYKRLFWTIRNDGFRGRAALALGHLDRVFVDLFARRAGQPVYRYLGGPSNEATAYNSGGGVNLSNDEALAEAQRMEGDGYKTIKIKFGGLQNTTGEDVARIQLIRAGLHPATELAIDANQSLDLKQALALIRALDGLDIAWLEEPLHSADLTAIRELCRQSQIPISYGENERSDRVFPTLAEFGVRHLQPIAGHLSSIQGWFATWALSQQQGLRFTSGGTSYFNAAFVAAAGPAASLEFLQPVLQSLEPIFSVMPEQRDGCFIVPETPGLGCQVDWSLLCRRDMITENIVWKR